MTNIKEITGAIILGGASATTISSGISSAQENFDYQNCFPNALIDLQQTPQPSPTPDISPNPDGSFDVFVSPLSAPASPLISENRLPILDSGEIDPGCYSFDFIYSIEHNPETDSVNRDQLIQVLTQQAPVVLEYLNSAGGDMEIEDFIDSFSDVLDANPEENDLGRNTAQRIAVNTIEASRMQEKNRPLANAQMIISIALLHYSDTNGDFRTKKDKKLSPERANEKMRKLIKEYQELLTPILSVD